MPDTTEFEEVPTMAVSNSEGGVTLQHKKSGRVIGSLPGDEPAKKTLERKRADKQFKKLIEKFMRIN